MGNWAFNSSIYTLNNGLNIITVKKDTQISSLHFGVKIGAMYEKDDEKGISHFIEHMIFKGTNSMNNEELNDSLELLGGEYNAYTDYGCTVYSITSLEEEIFNGIDLIGDMIMNSSFPEEEIEKERGVILSEIKSSKDDTEDFSFKKAYEKAFYKSPLRYDISGTEENVKKFAKKDLMEFYKKYYVPNNSYIVIVSSLDHKVVVEKIENVFRNWESHEVLLPWVEKESNNAGVFITEKNDLEQSTIVYIFDLNNIDKDMELPLKILSHRLGESSNSILFRELRENRGLAYDVYTDLSLSENIKTLSIYTAVDDENVTETIEIINEAIYNIKNRKVKFDSRAMEVMKKVHKTAVLSTLEDSTDLSNYVMHQSLDKENICEFISDMEKLEKMEDEHIYRAAEKVLKNPTIHLLRRKYRRD